MNSPIGDVLSPLVGFHLCICKELTGTKKAYKTGNTLHVSPAMFSLMETADQEFLTLLCQSIQVVDLGEYKPFDLLPMTTVRP